MRNPSIRVYRPFVDARVPHYHVALVRDESVPYETESVRISTPEDVAVVCADLRGEPAERFELLLLSTKGNLVARVHISTGSLNASLVHPRECIRPAVVANAASAIVVHNHPSGDSTPSGADIQLCRRLSKAFDLCGVELLDSCVIGGGEHGTVSSMRDLGLL